MLSALCYVISACTSHFSALCRQVSICIDSAQNQYAISLEGLLHLQHALLDDEGYVLCATCHCGRRIRV